MAVQTATLYPENMKVFPKSGNPYIATNICSLHQTDVYLAGYLNTPAVLKRARIDSAVLYFYAYQPNGQTIAKIQFWAHTDDASNWSELTENLSFLGEEYPSPDSSTQWGINFTGTGSGNRDALCEMLAHQKLICLSSNQSDGKITIYTSAFEAKRPYFTINYEPYPVDLKNCQPASGSASKNAPLTIRAQGISSHAQRADTYASKCTFRYRDGASGNFTEVTANCDALGNAQYTIPANTLKQASFQWGVTKLVSQDGVTSTFSNLYTLSTADSLSSAAPVSPLNVQITIDTANTFTWRHIIASGTAQAKAELQYSVNQVTWNTFFTANGSGQSCTVPANKLPSGRVWWRVRTYNSDNIAGSWSAAAAIIGYGAPSAPVISGVTNKARPTISWQSEQQVTYGLVIKQGAREVFRIDEGVGTEKSCKLKDYLPDGNYTVQMRVKNAQGFWSPWASQGFSISTSKPTKPILSAAAAGETVVLTVDLKGAAKGYLFRDGIPFTKAVGTYIDYTAAGSHRYFLRAVSASDSFADSSSVYVTAYPRWSYLSPADDPKKQIPLRLKKDVGSTFDGNLEIQGTELFFQGRALPVYEYSGFESETFVGIFALTEWNDWEALKALARKRRALLYRDFRGNRFYCIISRLSSNQDAFTTEFTLELMRVDYIEQIDFD